MTNEFKIISEDGLKTLCKAIKKVSTIGEIIDDVNSVTDKTYSSFEIDRRLNTKIDKTQLTTVLDENVTDEQIPGAKVVVDELGLKANDSEVVKKTDIATTLNSTSTDGEVPSAKVVYNATRKFFKTYTSIQQLGLTSGSETIEDIVNSMESSTRLITVIEGGNLSIYPNTSGTLIVEKLNIYRVHFKFCMDGLPTVFVGTYHAVSGFTGWHRLCTTKVADVDKVIITTQNLTVGVVGYFVKNGICYVSISGITPSLNSGSTIITANSLPLPNNKGNNHYTISTTSGAAGLFVINNDGSAVFYGQNTLSYFGQFSYPVAE